MTGTGLWREINIDTEERRGESRGMLMSDIRPLKDGSEQIPVSSNFEAVVFTREKRE